MLAGRRLSEGGQYGGGKTLGAHLLEGIGIGVIARVCLEAGRFHVDERARDPLANRRAESGDHALARVNRHVAESDGRVIGVGIELRDERNLRQAVDRLLDLFLK